ncbi:MAG: cytochrome C oxidase subunit IV family protein [Planctomycetaceae bacterium]|nr:cytochrome C oxidase subunit IV family protein [Planctomycetaceae bacterium]
MNQTTDQHSPNYLAIFGILCVLTIISVVADLVSVPGLKILVACIVLAVATAKAAFVMLYFMHLKFERNWKYAILMPTIILAIGLLLVMIPDISLHYYDLDIPQVP